MVFWNREFSQEVASNYRAGLHAEAGSDYGGTARADQLQHWDGSTTTAEANGHAKSTLDLSVGSDRIDNDRTGPLDDIGDLAVEAAFSETLVAGGARLVDRNLAMRTSRDGRNVGSLPNMQAIETEAVAGRADLLIEILRTSSSAPGAGSLYKVTVKDIRSARLVAIFASSGHQPAIKPQLVAGPGGFVRAEAPVGTSPEHVGRGLADEVMTALARSLH